VVLYISILVNNCFWSIATTSTAS